MDTEVLMPVGPHAVLATASSPRAWYGWVSPQLLDSSRGGELISIGPMDKPRLIVGHNVSFDRARIAEEYAPTRTTTRFLDTMSLHMAVAGLTGAQRGIFKRVQRVRGARCARRGEGDR